MSDGSTNQDILSEAAKEAAKELEMSDQFNEEIGLPPAMNTENSEYEEFLSSLEDGADPEEAVAQPQEAESDDPEDEGGDLSLDQALEEIQKLKRKLGKQGSERGDLLSRVEEAERRYQALEQKIGQPAEQAPPKNGREFVRQLAEVQGVDLDMEGLSGDLFAQVGDLMLGYTKMLAGDLRPVLDELRGGINGLRNERIEAQLPKNVQAKLLEENPELTEIQDPAKRVAMMKKMAKLAGLLPTKAQTTATEPSRRDPARHVPAGGAATPNVPKQVAKDSAFMSALESANTPEEMKRLERILAGELAGKW